MADYTLYTFFACQESYILIQGTKLKLNGGSGAKNKLLLHCIVEVATYSVSKWYYCRCDRCKHNRIISVFLRVTDDSNTGQNVSLFKYLQIGRQLTWQNSIVIAKSKGDQCKR